MAVAFRVKGQESGSGSAAPGPQRPRSRSERKKAGERERVGEGERERKRDMYGERESVEREGSVREREREKRERGDDNNESLCRGWAFFSSLFLTFNTSLLFSLFCKSLCYGYPLYTSEPEGQQSHCN